MATPTLLEDFFNISENTYTTESEWLDGLIIGLATLLLIRNAELIVVDILTFFFGNRPHRVGFRVLRTWQMLTFNQFVKLVTGYDNDLPRSRLREMKTSRSWKTTFFPQTNWKITKGRFTTWLFLFVLLGKVLVLGAEVAIIAAVIPDAKVHRSPSGLGFRWKNTTITEDSLVNLPTCLQLFSSRTLTDTVGLTLCKRLVLVGSWEALPKKWIANGTLRLEEVFLTEQVAKKAGGKADENGMVLCESSLLEEDSGTESSAVERTFINTTRRQVSIGEEPSASIRNSLTVAELSISGNLLKQDDGEFFGATGGIQPVFRDAEKTLRLGLPDFVGPGTSTIGTMVPLLNGRLVYGGTVSQIEGATEHSICREVLDEIIRVTGTLDHELMVDIIRLSIAPTIRDNLTEPSADFDAPVSDQGFQIGVSRRFSVPPEWMAAVAAVTVVLSALTSRLNKTEARMARVYREHNKMLSACSPVYLDKEVAVDGGLFRRGEEYHWGADLGEEWEELDEFDFSGKVILV